jgi:hypothetical protein
MKLEEGACGEGPEETSGVCSEAARDEREVGTGAETGKINGYWEVLWLSSGTAKCPVDAILGRGDGSAEVTGARDLDSETGQNRPLDAWKESDVR